MENLADQRRRKKLHAKRIYFMMKEVKVRLHPKGAFQNLCLSHGLHRAGGNTNLKVCLRDAD